jgi:hypothetical protein
MAAFGAEFLLSTKLTTIHYIVQQDDVDRRLTTHLDAESLGDTYAGNKYQLIERMNL